MSKDTYPNYKALKEKHAEGTDYKISTFEDRSQDFVVVAPHAGKIERGTTEISRAIAGENYCLYLFEGNMKGKISRNYRLLHITSHHFDEPKALALVVKCKMAIGIHGRSDDGDIESTFLGGLNDQAAKVFKKHLKAGGFPTKIGGHKFPAKEPKNICDLGVSKKGVQLELPLTLRKKLLKNPDKRTAYAACVRAALKELNTSGVSKPA